MNRINMTAKVLVHALFWPWNLCFLAIVAFGYVPLALIDLVADAFEGLARWDFVAGSIVLVLLPVVVTIQAVRALRKDAGDLALVFFGVELPLFFFVLARLFGFQDLSGAARLVVVALIAGGLAALVRVMFSARVAASPVVTVVVHALLAVLVVAGSYIGFLLALWSVPIFLDGVIEIVGSVFSEFRWNWINAESIVAVFFGVVPALWVAITVVVFLALPVAAPLTWVRLLQRSGQAVSGAWSRSVALAATVVPAAVVVAAFFVLLPQPHEDTLVRLRAPVTNDAERQALLDDRAHLRAGLVDAYLSDHRYLSDDQAPGYYSAWTRAWRPFVGEDAALDVAAFVYAAGQPFVFQGKRADRAAAGGLYRAFFGKDLERENAGVVKDALAATWSREERYAGFINEGERRVRLVRQDVDTVAAAPPFGGVVDVEVHDEWTNLTPTDAEVALFFELPETAALTGLWLSPDGKRENAFAFVTAPRGAAQQVYNEQVRQRRDPALLEQVGPRQYRLRVFPVPAKHIDRDSGRFLPQGTDGWRNAANQPRQHVWMTYQALVGADGLVPFPALSERRNGFWDDETERFVNHQSIKAVDGDDGGGWVQGRVEAATSSSVEASLEGGSCFRFVRGPAPEVNLQGQVVDVVIDRSLAMEPQREALATALAALEKTGATLRYVLGTSKLRNEKARAADVVDPRSLLFFGAASAKELVSQYVEVRPEGRGSMAVILTAQGTFDVADDAPLPADLALLRTVIVHLGGALPAGYDDTTIDAIRRSGGTAVANIDEALARLAGRAWVDGVAIEPCKPSSSSGHGKLAARQQILAADRGGKPDPAALDVLHAVAKSAGVVTPYSSMICLVDEAQRARLKQLEEQQDRFDREVEVGAKVPGQNPLFGEVSGVPEPHEWLLLMLGGVAVVVMTRRRPAPGRPLM